jgi:hypothetical protein
VSLIPVNDIIVVTYDSKCHRLSLSLIDVNGIRLMTRISLWLIHVMEDHMYILSDIWRIQILETGKSSDPLGCRSTKTLFFLDFFNFSKKTWEEIWSGLRPKRSFLAFSRIVKVLSFLLELIQKMESQFVDNSTFWKGVKFDKSVNDKQIHGNRVRKNRRRQKCQELTSKMCWHNMESEHRSQTIMLHVRPSPIY